ncbi:MAG TPA: hypothetical protein VJT71_14415 [Pyrinomonadaceae bacterium]|nr:hypothetical protein [Pyrinomonadaceae bacterium]
MSNSKSFWCVAAVAVALVTRLAVANAAEKKDKEQKQPAKARQAQKQQLHPVAPAKSASQDRQQPQHTEKNQTPKTPEPRVESKPQKGEAHPVPNRSVKAEPEKSKAHQSSDQFSNPKTKVAPDEAKTPQPKKEKEKAKNDKEATVHARQPATTVTPQQTQLLRPTPPPCKLTEVKKPGGVIERVSPSNKVRERTVVEQKTGAQRTQQLGVTGRVEVEEVKRKDGTRQLTQYDLGREKKIQVVRKDGCTETTDVHYNRNGEPRARETIIRDTSGRAVSKTVVVQQNVIIRNTTVIHNNARVANNATVVRTYYPGRYGFVYRPVVPARIVFSSWYDPYWYSPAGVVVYHPFRYSWGWHNEPWFRCHAHYWAPYPVYPAPCFWITDWLVAGYVADRYAAAASAEQTREEVRLAREEAEKARIAAEQARDSAEIAEAKAAQAAAEARAERAEARAAKAELEEAKAKEFAGKPNPKATPIDKETKDALKDQIEQVIAEKKQYAELAGKGTDPVLPDVTASLGNPKHIFPVSKTISVIRAQDSSSAGVLTAGDLLRAEPGQEKLIAEANENTPITMRVITSKGDDDSVPAGTLVAIPLKELQEFDNEFRAKIDVGLTEANNNKEVFKKEAVN